MSVIVKREMKRVVEDIRSGSNTNASFNKLTSLLKESLLLSDISSFDAIINNSYVLLKQLLRDKYKLDERESSDELSINILGKIYLLHYIGYKYCKTDVEEYIAHKILYSKCIMIDEIYKYGNQKLINLAIDNLKEFFGLLCDVEKYVLFFIDCFFQSKETYLTERISFLYDFSLFLSSIEEVSYNVIFSSIIDKISDKAIDINESMLVDFFSCFETCISLKETNPSFIEHVLTEMWQLSIGDDQKDVIDDFITFKRNGRFFVKPTHINCLAVYNFLKNHSKKDVILKDEKHYKIYLTNVLSYINFSNRINSLELLPLSKEIIVKIDKEYGRVLYAAIKSGKSNYVNYYLSNIVDFAETLESSDKSVQKVIIDIFRRLLVSLSDVESKDKITYIVNTYQNILLEWDKKKSISNDLSKSIVDNIFEIINNYISSLSPYASDVFELADLLFVYPDNESILSFVSKEKNSFFPLISEKAFNTGINAIEYGNNDMIKKASNFIGWTLLDAIKSCQDNVYKLIYKKYAYALLKTLLSFGYDNSTILFVSTLFVVIFTCCFGYKEFAQQYKFAQFEINNLKEKEVEFIIKSSDLRKGDNWTIIENYSFNMEKLNNVLRKKLDNFKNINRIAN